MTTDPSTNPTRQADAGAPVWVPDTVCPLVFHPDTGRLYWLDRDDLVCTPVTADASPAADAIRVPATTRRDDPAVAEIEPLLRDIATYTCRPMRQPAAPPTPDGYDEYTVVWVANAFHTGTPREAAEQAWHSIRRHGSQACVFEVLNRRTGQRTRIDLLDDEPDHDGGQPSVGEGRP